MRNKGSTGLEVYIQYQQKCLDEWHKYWEEVKNNPEIKFDCPIRVSSNNALFKKVFPKDHVTEIEFECPKSIKSQIFLDNL